MIRLTSRSFLKSAGTGATLMFLAGCSATTPVALEQARVNVAQAQRNPEITAHAPVALHEAEQSLANAEETWKKTENETEVEHLAYLTNKKVQIAQQTSQREMAEAEAKRLTAEREKVLLQARQREIQQAKQLAEARERAAETARRQAQASGLAAERARREAQEQAQKAEQARLSQERLEQQLSELKARQTERGLELTLQDVLFEFDRADLKPGALRVLAPLIAYLKENPDREVALEGHTDSVGSDAYNLELSRRRAEAVRDLLIQSGISGERIVAQGLGESYPVASNATEAGRLQNRRVEIIISQGS